MSEMGPKLKPPSCLLGEACLLRAKEWGRKLALGTSFGPRAGHTSPFHCPHMPYPLSSLAMCISQPTILLMSKPRGGGQHFSASSESTFQPPLLLLETLCSPAVCEAQSAASLWSLQLLPSSFPPPASPLQLLPPHPLLSSPPQTHTVGVPGAHPCTLLFVHTFSWGAPFQSQGVSHYLSWMTCKFVSSPNLFSELPKICIIQLPHLSVSTPNLPSCPPLKTCFTLCVPLGKRDRQPPGCLHHKPGNHPDSCLCSPALHI